MSPIAIPSELEHTGVHNVSLGSMPAFSQWGTHDSHAAGEFELGLHAVALPTRTGTSSLRSFLGSAFADTGEGNGGEHGKEEASYSVGEQVRALYQRTGNWLSATISNKNPDGTYTVKWESGDQEDNIKKADELEAFAKMHDLDTLKLQRKEVEEHLKVVDENWEKAMHDQKQHLGRAVDTQDARFQQGHEAEQTERATEQTAEEEVGDGSIDAEKQEEALQQAQMAQAKEVKDLAHESDAIEKKMELIKNEEQADAIVAQHDATIAKIKRKEEELMDGKGSPEDAGFCQEAKKMATAKKCPLPEPKPSPKTCTPKPVIREEPPAPGSGVLVFAVAKPGGGLGLRALPVIVDSPKAVQHQQLLHPVPKSCTLKEMEEGTCGKTEEEEEDLFASDKGAAPIDMKPPPGMGSGSEFEVNALMPREPNGTLSQAPTPAAWRVSGSGPDGPTIEKDRPPVHVQAVLPEAQAACMPLVPLAPPPLSPYPIAAAPPAPQRPVAAAKAVGRPCVAKASSWRHPPPRDRGFL